MQGTIARVTERGFGFITPEGGDKDIFFHANELADGVQYNELQVGDKVTFDEAEGPKGPNAVNVALAN